MRQATAAATVLRAGRSDTVITVDQQEGESCIPHRPHSEQYPNERICWPRAAVLGSNDGIISTAYPLLCVSAANAERSELLTAGVAALVTGAMSMAVGEYVSVNSQHDALSAHAREEFSIREDTAARPVQATVTSAITFFASSALPLLTATLLPFLIMLGWLGATIS